MSAADDIVILTEYAEWRQERATGGTEDRLSVAVFIEEREHAANERRIEKALALVAAALADTEDMLAEDIAALEQIRDALVDDREVIEDRSIAGPTIRHFA